MADKKYGAVVGATLIFVLISLSACTSMSDMETAKRAARHEDYQTAYTHYSALSDFGLPQAKLELGKLYLNGKGVESDPQKALVLFQEAEMLGENRFAPQYIKKARLKLTKLEEKAGHTP